MLLTNLDQFVLRETVEVSDCTDKNIESKITEC